MRNYFTAGSTITWKQYPTKESKVCVSRTGSVWCDAPKFEGAAGAHVWVIPDQKYPNEKSAIAVRVFRAGTRRGDAELREDSPAYRDWSLK